MAGKNRRNEAEAAFLDAVAGWRDMLTHDVALRNPGRDSRVLGAAVQRLLCRLLFLRICEARGAEPHGCLQASGRGAGVYRRLCRLFRHADQQYRLGLEPRDAIPQELHLEDPPLREILAAMYAADHSHLFAVLPAEILGQAYEQSLSTVARPVGRRRLDVPAQPGRRKAGGVYYTPAAMVDYVLRRTLGELLEGRTPQQIRRQRLRLLDPACGGGSFLIGASQHLMAWHRQRYIDDGPERYARGRRPALCRNVVGQWRLTAAEKTRILAEHVFGVDIDPQAVEVAKLSLLLTLLDGENGPGPQDASRPAGDLALPDLADNIRCGNALIGPEYYHGRVPDRNDPEQARRINAFDWIAAFPQLFATAQGGFDVVVGNPPWGQKAVELDDSVKQYLRTTYQSLAGILDIFRPFIEKGVGLLRRGGMYGMVLPDIVLLKDYQETRRFLLEQLALSDIRWWGMAFEEATIDAVTIVGHRGPAAEDHRIHVTVDDSQEPLEHDIPQRDFLSNPRYTFNLLLTPQKRSVLTALDGAPRLGEFFAVHEGVHSGNLRRELFVDAAPDGSCRPLYFGRDEIAPYRLQWNGRYVRRSVVPATRGGDRYANLGRPEWYERPKILVRRTGDRVMAAVDEHGFYASNNFFVVFPAAACSLDLYGLCALLNSRWITWYFRTIEPRRGRVFCELKIKHLRAFPLPRDVIRPEGCRELNALGRRRARQGLRQPRETSRRARPSVDRRIDACVAALLGLGEAPVT